MLMRRVIPCLDVRDGRVVKGVRFDALRDCGDPADRAALYAAGGADELVLLDVAATINGRSAQLEVVRRVRRVLSIPLTVGGGVRSLEDVGALLDAGADKVSVNSAAVREPALLRRMADRFGTQCTVLAIDARRCVSGDGVRWQVLVRSGTRAEPLDAVTWARHGVACGAGEILLTSHDRDGTRAGYDLDLVRSISSAVSVPVIASGGADRVEHLLEAFACGADAVLAASIFHDGATSVDDVKRELAGAGVVVRQGDSSCGH